MQLMIYAIVVFAISAVGGTPGLLTLGLLVVAAVGGLALLLPMHLKKVVAPAWVVIVHASVGTIGFLMIILVAFVLNVTPDLADPNAVAPNLR